MSRASKRHTILRIIATDSSFRREEVRGREVWVGKCIHSGRKLVVGLDGEPISRATIEHIVPKNHGGTDELENLALADARANHQKGIRHDSRRKGDPKLQEIIERLQERRRQRWRDPIDVGTPGTR
jgi:5-methylcytosine-specific restriction endonuclease McrA